MLKTITKNDTKSMLSTEIKYIFQTVTGHTFTPRLHTHTFYEFICVLSGSCTHFADGVSNEMSTDDFMLLSPGIKHCFLSQSEDASLLCVSVSVDEFQKYKLLYGDTLTSKNSVPVQLSISACNVLNQHVSDLNSPTQNEIRAVCSSFLSNYCDIIGESNSAPPVLINMTEQMLKNPNYLQIGIAAMTTLSSYSESQLGRLTKKYYNASPHEYLKHLRLEKAWQYILQTDLSLEEISHLCGYNCYGYFTNIFKDKYGLSPAALRKTKH